jgi:DNA-binding NtrC family response regulator
LEGALAVAGEDPILFSKHLPVHIRVHLARKSVDENKQNTSNPDTDSDLNKPLPEFRAFRKSLEKDYLQKLISYSKRDIKRACQISGLSRSRLYELFSNYSLSMSDSK